MAKYRKAGRRILATAVLLVAAVGTAFAQAPNPFDAAREKMVADDIIAGGIKNKRVIEAMRAVPRHEFVPLAERGKSYYDMALPIGQSQTISSPFIVAFMTEQLDPRPKDRVLEIGTGSGYQAAVLGHIVAEAFSIEIVPELGRKARRALRKYPNVKTKIGDGYQGWAEHAPFDKIIVTCSPEKPPQPLIDQLAEGGRMVIPVGERYQQSLCLFTKKEGKLVAEALRPTFFVPMTGAAEDRRVLKPDPAHPSIGNVSFEDVAKETELPAAWYYLRQGRIDEGDAPDGDRYLTFANETAGLTSHVLQGFAVDGRKVKQLRVTLHVKYKGVRPGRTRDEFPLLGVTYFDSRRAALGQRTMGRWLGSSEWYETSAVMDVPVQAREGSIRIGLFGAVGELSVDNVRIEAFDPRAKEEEKAK